MSEDQHLLPDHPGTCYIIDYHEHSNQTAFLPYIAQLLPVASSTLIESPDACPLRTLTERSEQATCYTPGVSSNRKVSGSKKVGKQLFKLHSFDSKRDHSNYQALLPHTPSTTRVLVGSDAESEQFLDTCTEERVEKLSKPIEGQIERRLRPRDSVISGFGLREEMEEGYLDEEGLVPRCCGWEADRRWQMRKSNGEWSMLCS